MLVLDDVLARDRLGVGERLLDGVHARGGHARRDERLDPLVRRARREDLLEDRQQLVAVLVAAGHGREALVLVQIGPADHVAQPLPELPAWRAPTTNQPSAASKFWNGTIDGWAEFGRRGGT